MTTRVGVSAAAAVVAVAVLMGTGVSAQSTSPWLHVRVMEAGEDSPSVNVNLPLSAVRALLDLVPDRIASHGRIRLHRHHDMSVSDLKAVWQTVRDTIDGEFVSVDTHDGHVRVARHDDVIDVRFDGDDDDKQVRIEIPIAVVDALLSGDDDSLDLAAALDALKDRRGDIVRIIDGDERIRVWIDEG